MLLTKFLKEFDNSIEATEFFLEKKKSPSCHYVKLHARKTKFKKYIVEYFEKKEPLLPLTNAYKSVETTD